jgi:DNA-binding IclR family transcriptional regulator
MARPAPAALRAVTILDFLAERPTESFTLSEIARGAGLTLSSTQTVLGELVGAGYLIRLRSRKAYALGPAISVLGHAVSMRHPSLVLAEDAIEKLGRELGKELLLIVSAGPDVVAVARWGRRRPRGLDIGRRVPLAAPLGGIFVAWGSDDEQARWMAAGGVTDDHSIEACRQLLASTRLHGYSVTMETTPHIHSIIDAIAEAATKPGPSTRQDLQTLIQRLEFTYQDNVALEEPNRYAVRSIAAPIFDTEGRVLVTISTADLPAEMTVSEIADLGSRLRDVAVTVTTDTEGLLPPEFLAR